MVHLYKLEMLKISQLAPVSPIFHLFLINCYILRGRP